MKTSSGRAKGRPPRLSKEDIVAAARDIIADEGAEQLTMRRLAREIGCTAMALYHHFQSKDDLLLHVLEDVAARLPHPVLPADPRERLVLVCGLMRQAFVENPWVVPLVARGEMVAPSAVWMTEEIIAALVGCGLSVEQAFDVNQTIWYYTAGQVAAAVRQAGEAGQKPAGPHYLETIVAEQGEQRSAETMPYLSRLAGVWRDLEAGYSYQRGLHHILDGALDPDSHPAR
ncbi:TetR family transcriptional regulator [Longimycelium tulufanense]|uniref:TetR family transcriptional regulator n=1 Tax=Longimycelium tulufanense TaxID=907463 RepID=A0A8J3C7E8_9PSEU|nr:TetR/AcrR family transcriptional regulator [Longimycelium tulufanense]GGM49266.1 TetR family transcriptional regulator [Longimycelium tulufanense]